MSTFARLLVFATLLSASSARAFTLDQILTAPFATDLVVAPDGRRLAWVGEFRGRNNVWLAELGAGGQPGGARAVTRYTADDGAHIADLVFVGTAGALAYVRGGDLEYPDQPAANPAQDVDGVAQEVYLVPAGGGTPRRLGPGHAPVAAPQGDRLLFLRAGEVWSVSTAARARPERLFVARGAQDTLRFSPDGRRLAFVSHRGDHSFIGVYAFAERTLQWLDPSSSQDLEPTWSPDGRELAFLRLPWTHDEVGIGPHRRGTPWSVRVTSVDGRSSREVYRAPAGTGSVYQPLAGGVQLVFSDERIVFPAEADGWCHLYAVPRQGGEARLLTPGPYEVEYLAASADGRTLVLASNADDIDRRHLWRLTPADAAPVALTHGSGIETEPAVSADGRTLAFLGADAQHPMHARLFRGEADPVPVGGEPLPASFPATELVTPVSVTLSARDGVSAHGQLFLPPAGSAAPHPAVVFMHGGPVRQMLAGYHYMDYYSHAYAMNQYLANHGYVVLALNYRSGIGYGRDFREAEHFGSTGASEYGDVLAAAEFLRARPDVDGTRLGLWGGSYGGYLTALGLARNSELFAAGVDLHGVHDWYNWSLGEREGHPYYAGDVGADQLATAWAASPMSAVASWRSPVLLIHGDDDHNVPFNETVRLAAALRARGVPTEELVFPDEIHDFLRDETWRRAYAATVDFLDRHLSRP